MERHTDILLIVPLKEEFEYISSELGHFEADKRIYNKFKELPPVYRLEHPSGLRISAVILNVMSNETSALVVERCISRLDPRLVVAVGIAGSLDNDIRLADVVVGDAICSYMSESKAEGKDDEIKMKYNGVSHVFAVGDRFRQFFANLSTHTSRKAFEEWRQEGRKLREELGLATTGEFKEGRKRVSVELGGSEPRLHVGSIASGPTVGASEPFREELKAINRKFHALEMEGAGIARACAQRSHADPVDFLLLRGISDFADKRKQALEARSGRKWRELATRNAARLFELCLSSETFRSYIRRRPQADTPIHIALFLSGHSHYVDSIVAGFREELSHALANTRFWPHIIQAVGRPGQHAHEANVCELKRLVDEFGVNGPRFIVSVGTAASLAARKLCFNDRPIIYLGVSEPARVGFTPASSELVAGVSYGVSIADTVEIIRAAFPKLRPTFVLSPDQYAQDQHLLEALRERYNDEQVPAVSLNEPSEIDFNLAQPVFFGRFFLCNNMSHFVRLNPKHAFVGVSADNVMRGAILSIGYDTLEIGRIGARDIVVPVVRNETRLSDVGQLRPEGLVIAYNEGIAAKIGVTISDAIRLRLTHVVQ